MEMFSRCFKLCDNCIIHYVGGCMAGHGDYDFIQITEKKAIDILKENHIDDYHKELIYKKFPGLMPIDKD